MVDAAAWWLLGTERMRSKNAAGESSRSCRGITDPHPAPEESEENVVDIRGPGELS